MSDQFSNQKYLNLETYRKSGESVRTPVWFARDGDDLMVWTQEDSGKAKRIRRSGSVKVVPCKSMGEPTGTWLDATATSDSSPQAQQALIRLMQAKYGFAFRLAHLGGKLRKAVYTTLRIRLNEPA